MVFLLGSLSFVYSQDENLIDLCTGENPLLECEEGLNLFGENFDVSEGVLSFLEGGGKLILNKGQENEIVLEGTEGLEITDLSEITFLEGGAVLSINGNSFGNIAPRGEENEAFIHIDKITGDVSKCKFWVEEEYTYLINGVSFDAPPNSRVFFDNENGFSLADGTKINNLDESYIEKGISIGGKDIEVLDDFILRDGNMKIDSNGYLLDSGSATSNGKFVFSSEKTGSVLFANAGSDLSNYNGNYILDKEGILEIHSAENGRVPVGILGDDSVYNFQGDEKLSFYVSDGASLKIQKGNSEFSSLLTPDISGDGSITINNGGMRDIVLNKDGTFLKGGVNEGSSVSMKILHNSEEITVDNTKGFSKVSEVVDGTKTITKTVNNYNVNTFNTEEKYFKESDGSYTFVKQIKEGSKYYVSGTSPSQSFAKTKGMSEFRTMLNYDYSEEDLKQVDEGGDRILNARELFNLRKLIVNRR